MPGGVYTKGNKVKTAFFTHFLAFAISLGACVLYFLIYLRNVPLDYSAATQPKIALRNRFWLVELWVAQPNGTDTTTLTHWGFGVWGWCGTTETNRVGEEKCVLHGGWTLPADADKNGVTNLGLASAITKSLGPASILLIINVVIRLVCTIWILVTYMLPGKINPKAFEALPKTPKGKKLSLRTRMGFWLMGPRPFVPLFLNTVFAVTVLIIAGVGTQQTVTGQDSTIALGMGTKLYCQALTPYSIFHSFRQRMM
ncbi:hypothetical protein TREMEDRAFT_59103 [Tremella mesenterica DSM 1558]|uniref:uncharacterized protein n=1 Tax=Tremella mesenterica (strain ATCC 24925 / CBS 8224 / DSM 1558 / NBRC 9311 / NRRL Y-6157 / RJB 2259-6 / UBC 559-6) TaxID=578456 RepID=UPI0003F49E32|nr:uncharacterized protein TREMEDRAFT_59103 [Tremella mesenterica DSM 1558]EIW72943.1 hypothetical protein TREMEDRAFT_59103 [Tremella mesenterica DSM 1558]